MITELNANILEDITGGLSRREAARARFAARRAELIAARSGDTSIEGVTVSINRDADGNEIGRSVSRSGGSSSGGGFSPSAAIGLGSNVGI